MSRIHVVCSARNAGPWLGELLESLAGQTHEDWELSIRDDGSADETWEVIEAWRRREPRITRAVRGDRPLGTAQGFAQLLAALPSDANAVATADADDVWLADKLAISLAELRAREAGGSHPILVHTDLRPVDVNLRELAPSFWEHVGIDPSCSAPRLVAIQNVAVGPTQLFNGHLLELVRTIPSAAACQDWWIALVASCMGTIAPLDPPTVLYRRHGANDSAAKAHGLARVAQLGRVALDGSRARRQLDVAARQAAAVVQMFGARMQPRVCAELEAFAGIADLRGAERKRAIVRWRWHPAHGFLRNAGVVLRG